MKVCYITAELPYSLQETFIMTEIQALLSKNVDIIIIPIKPRKKLPKAEDNMKLSKFTVFMPLIDIFTIIKALKIILKKPLKVFKLLLLTLTKSNSIKNTLKNLAAFPKALAAAEAIQKINPDFIHVHWLSVYSTVGLVAAELTGVPFGITAHRYDIYQNNLINEKAKRAKFIRAINNIGAEDIKTFITGEEKEKVLVLHMGVDLPKLSSMELYARGLEDEEYSLPEFDHEMQNQGKPCYSEHKPFVMATPANLEMVKGHKYMLEAVKLLSDQGFYVHWDIYGDGPCMEILKQFCQYVKINRQVEFKGRVPLQTLLKKYREGKVDCVVLPSITVNKNEHEGIPVCLMEAMACCIPVISTNTGGIPELLQNGAGIIVNEKSPEELAEAVKSLYLNRKLYNTVRQSGFRRVKEEFSSEIISDRLISLFHQDV
jgi:glycosyltransferase involved in cell wall biosynthesis